MEGGGEGKKRKKERMFQSKQIKTKLVVTSRGIKLAVNHTINNNGSKKKKKRKVNSAK